MEEKGDRYIGPPTTRYHYLNEFQVECPKCAGAALVMTRQSVDTSQDKLICPNCNYREMADERIRYTATVNQACRNCGEAIQINIPNNKEKLAGLKYSCPHCDDVQVYKPGHTVVRLKYPGTYKLADPVFNLPLWFQANVKGDTLWANNKEHLLEIRNYVTAKLRERQVPNRTTMVEKLPQFIKAAKNRETILRVIDKMLKR